MTTLEGAHAPCAEASPHPACLLVSCCRGHPGKIGLWPRLSVEVAVLARAAAGSRPVLCLLAGRSWYCWGIRAHGCRQCVVWEALAGASFCPTCMVLPPGFLLHWLGLNPCCFTTQTQNP